ncbi:MAG: hypothetical protein ACLGGV_03130 [Bacteroidia bacterium]
MTEKKDWFLKFDKLSYGVISGISAAIIGFMLNYFFNPYLFNRFWFFLTEMKRFHLGIVGDMMTMSLLLPMIIFYFSFFRRNYQHFSKGLLLVIFPIVIFIIFLEAK